MKSAFASILVVLGACDRAAVDPPRAFSQEAASSEAIMAAASSSVTAPTRPVPVATSSARTTNDRPVANVKSTRAREAPKTVYACPMHPEVNSGAPGVCPKCNMKLAPKTQSAEIREAPAALRAPL